MLEQHPRAGPITVREDNSALFPPFLPFTGSPDTVQLRSKASSKLTKGRSQQLRSKLDAAAFRPSTINSMHHQAVTQTTQGS